MKKTFFLSFFILISGIYANSQQYLSKAEVVELYERLYLSSNLSYIDWNGSIEQCYSGYLDSDIYDKAVDRVNFFRLVNGLTKISLNPAYNEDAQNAALLIKANNTLTHYPSEDMKCYSESAANGCAKSNLAFTDFVNYNHIAFITGLMYDWGESNYYVGHRRWILYTYLAKIGYGATDKSEALYTGDGYSFDISDFPEFTAYPWHGYVPINLIFPKWSFSIPEAKDVSFDEAGVSMWDEYGNDIDFNLLPVKKDYLDHTLVWQVTGLFSEYEIKYLKYLQDDSYLDMKIYIKIQHVLVDGEYKDYEYFVIPFKY